MLFVEFSQKITQISRAGEGQDVFNDVGCLLLDISDKPLLFKVFGQKQFCPFFICGDTVFEQ